MSVRPITFSAPMVRALLDGRKTQTRRIIKSNGLLPSFCGGRGDTDDPACWGWEDCDFGDWVTLEKEPGQRMGWRDWRSAPHVGDLLWVREAHALVPATAYRMSDGVMQTIDPQDSDRACVYRAGWERCVPGSWRSPTQMPRWASRLTLRVTDVRVQRVQDIGDDDALAEGVELCAAPVAGHDVCIDGQYWPGGPTSMFRRLWNSIHGPDAWDRNDWVCALTFDVLRQNVDEAQTGEARP